MDLHREGNSRLVIFHGGEGPRLVGRDGGVARNDNTEDVALHGHTEGEGGDVKEEEVLSLLGSLTGEDGGLDGGTIGDSFIGVDGLVESTATEELADKGLDLGNTSGATDENDVVDLKDRAY